MTDTAEATTELILPRMKMEAHRSAAKQKMDSLPADRDLVFLRITTDRKGCEHRPLFRLPPGLSGEDMTKYATEGLYVARNIDSGDYRELSITENSFDWSDGTVAKPVILVSGLRNPKTATAKSVTVETVPTVEVTSELPVEQEASVAAILATIEAGTVETVVEPIEPPQTVMYYIKSGKKKVTYKEAKSSHLVDLDVPLYIETIDGDAKTYTVLDDTQRLQAAGL